jgi:hypothetical protein
MDSDAPGDRTTMPRIENRAAAVASAIAATPQKSYRYSADGEVTPILSRFLTPSARSHRERQDLVARARPDEVID